MVATIVASSSRGVIPKISCIAAIRDYVSRVASGVSGMKVLVLDKEMTPVISIVYTQTQILQVGNCYVHLNYCSTTHPHCHAQHEVFLIDSIESNGRSDKMAHMKALYFIRPTHENVHLLQQEFKEPK